MSTPEIEQRIATSKPLDFGNIFNDAIELFKKTWTQGLITTLLGVGLILPFYFILYLPFIALGLDPEVIDASESVNVLVVALVVLLFAVFIVLASAVSLALQAVFFRICKQKDFGDINKDDYFYYFKKPYLLKLVKLSVVILLISFAATLMCFLPIIYAIVPISFCNVVFAFNPEKSVKEIVTIAFKLGHKKWLISFGLIVICGFLAEMVGILFCFVGIFATASFAYLPLYLIYKEVIGFENLKEEGAFIETTI